MSNFVNCLVCGGRDFTERLRLDDSSYFARTIVRCGQCSLVFVNPQPDEEELARVYNETMFSNQERASWDRKSKGFAKIAPDPSIASSSSPTPAQVRARYRLKLLKKLAPQKGSLLDIGSGPGVFLQESRRAGFDSRGVELSSLLAEYSAGISGCDVFCGTLENFANESSDSRFKIVSMWDVIEHLTNPAATLSAINSLQDNGDLLCLSTVNLMNYRYLLYGNRWIGFREGEEHLVFFSPATLNNLLLRSGYRPIKIMTRKISPVLLRWLNVARLGHSLEIFAVKTGPPEKGDSQNV